MQKWEYCELQVQGKQLYHFHYKQDCIETIPYSVPEGVGRPELFNKHIKKLAAQLGMRGWELAGIITINEGGLQQWIFKRPLP
jgi:hypothetical protein